MVRIFDASALGNADVDPRVSFGNSSAFGGILGLLPKHQKILQSGS
jgi:hypothetical protein